MDRIQELKLIVRMNERMGIVTEQLILDEIEFEEQKQEQRELTEQEHRNAIKLAFADLAKDLQRLIQEEKQKTTSAEPAPVLESHPEQKSAPTLIEAVVSHVKETNTPSMFVQPNPPTVDRDIKSIQNKLKLIEGWVSKISMTGPGGGAGEIYNLDMPTRVVTTSSYTVGRKDYYIGVNYAGTTTITLPSIVGQGRYIIIKDESGRCSQYPIIVQGNVDNDPNGFILKIDNGGIQMIYRDGWRIV